MNYNKFKNIYYTSKIIKCPVCKREDTINKVISHLMNSKKEQKHFEFIKKQDKNIKNIYKNDDIFCPYNIVIDNNLLCSPSYVRNFCKNFSDYGSKLSKKRSNDTSDQHKDGRRKKITEFAGGIKFTRKNGGKKYISKERYNKLIKLFSSNLNKKEICLIVNCKQETMEKVWKENFTEQQIEKRLLETSNKIADNIKKEILDLFYSDLTNRDIAKKFNVGNSYIRVIFLKKYSLEEYKKRCNRMRKIGIIKSLKITGKKGIIGSRAENYCYKLLRVKLGNGVMHHDMSNAEPYEIDISIPSKKVAISWDGPFHYKPIFGNRKLLRVQSRDKNKQTILENKGWKYISVKDDTNHYDPKFVELKVDEILEAINV